MAKSLVAEILGDEEVGAESGTDLELLAQELIDSVQAGDVDGVIASVKGLIEACKYKED